MAALFVILFSALQAEPITPDEAREVLRKAQRASAEPGSYRRQVVRTTKQSTTTTTILTRREADGRVFTRTETVTVPQGQNAPSGTRLSIATPEGNWQIYGHKAVLVPAPFQQGRMVDLLTEYALEPKRAANAGSGAAGKDDPASLRQRAMALASHIRIEGERFTEADRTLVRVTRIYDEEARRVIKRIIDEQVAALKKKLSLGKRMLVSTALALKGGIGEFIPARDVFVVDPEANCIVTTEHFNAAGKAIQQRTTPPPPEKIGDLPDETFLPPAGIEIIHAKDFGEAIDIAEKLEAEAKKTAATKT